MKHIAAFQIDLFVITVFTVKVSYFFCNAIPNYAKKYRIRQHIIYAFCSAFKCYILKLWNWYSTTIDDIPYEKLLAAQRIDLLHTSRY